MKRTVSALLAFLMVATLLVTPATAFSMPTVAITNTNQLFDTAVPQLYAVYGTPNVKDGIKDPVWGDVPSISSDGTRYLNTGAYFQNTTSEYYFMWDEDHFYILEERRNEVIDSYTAADTTVNAWSSFDCTMYNILLPSSVISSTGLNASAMMINTAPQTLTDSSATGMLADSKTFGREIQMKISGTSVSMTNKPYSYDISAASYPNCYNQNTVLDSKVVKTDTGYRIETAIPWEILDHHNRDAFSASTGEVIGMKIYQNSKGGTVYHVNNSSGDAAGYAQLMLVGNTMPDLSWYNPNETELYLSDASDLLGLAALTSYPQAYKGLFGWSSYEDITKGKTFRLLDNIDLNPDFDAQNPDTATQAANVWLGIAMLHGTFDGQGKRITGLYNNGLMPLRGTMTGMTEAGTTTGTEAFGFVGLLGTGGKITNLILENGYFNGDGNSVIGSVAGSASGNSSIQNVYSNLTVINNSTQSAGGIAGTLTASGSVLTVSNSVFAGSVTSTQATSGTGGIIGSVSDGAVLQLTDCLHCGSVTAPSYADGICGYNRDGNADSVLTTRVLSLASNAEALLDESAFNAAYPKWGWVMTDGFMMPSAISEMLHFSLMIQNTDITINSETGKSCFSARILSVLDSLNWNNVGFDITVTRADGSKVSRTYTTTRVYEAVMAAGERVEAKKLGGTYIYALEISNIPLDEVIRITVRPFKITVNGDRLEGAMTGNVLYREGKMSDEVLDWVAFTPAYTADPMTSSLKIDDNSAIEIYDNVSLADYEDYLAKLQKNGITDITNYTMGENHYALCKSYFTTLYVSYIAPEASMRIYTERAGLNNYPEASTTENYSTSYPDFWQLTVDNKGAKSNGGMSYVFRAEDGTFVIIDGGYNTELEADNLYAHLKEQTGDKEPVISGWYISHWHGDHHGALLAFSKKYASKVEVEAFYYQSSQMPEDVEEAMGRWSDATRYGRLHTGMNFNIKGLRFEVIFTREDNYPTVYADENNNSLVLRAVVGEKEETIIFLGDSLINPSNTILKNFKGSYEEVLKSNIVQFSHHGYEGATRELYDAIAAPTILWPMNIVGYQESGYSSVPQNVISYWIRRNQTSSGEGYTNYQFPNSYISVDAKYVQKIILHEFTTKIDLPYTPTGQKIPYYLTIYKEIVNGS